MAATWALGCIGYARVTLSAVVCGNGHYRNHLSGTRASSSGASHPFAFRSLPENELRLRFTLYIFVETIKKTETLSLISVVAHLRERMTTPNTGNYHLIILRGPRLHIPLVNPRIPYLAKRRQQVFQHTLYFDTRMLLPLQHLRHGEASRDCLTRNRDLLQFELRGGVGAASSPNRYTRNAMRCGTGALEADYTTYIFVKRATNLRSGCSVSSPNLELAAYQSSRSTSSSETIQCL